jgi:methionyl-tRNA formyltransferase
MAGDEVTGATTFLLEQGLDTGPTYGVMTETIKPTDTSGDLLARLARGGADLLVATLDALEAGDLQAVPQPDEGVSLAPKISVEDARICWDRPALAVDRHIRACTPEPGAWSTFRGERLKIHPVSLPIDPDSPHSSGAPGTPGDDLSQPGEVVAPGVLVSTKRAVLVGTASGAVRLGIVQPQSKKPMQAADWARGVRIEPGEVLGHE